MAILPLENEYQLNVLILGVTESPGLVVLSGHDRAKNWDNQKAKGTQGASSKLQGDDIGTFEATFFLAGDSLDDEGRSDFERWDAFERLIWTTVNGPKPTALPVYHPDLARNGFTEVVLAVMGGITYDGLGGASIKVKFQEYKPPKPKPAVKATAKAGSSTASKDRPDPNAAAKRELAALVAEAKKP